MKNKNKSKIDKKITADWVINDILAKNPDKVLEISELLREFGIHCVGCAVSSFERLGDGVLAHGFTEAELDKLVEDLNEIVSE